MSAIQPVAENLPPSAPPLRWGVLGAARIARKVLPALRGMGAEIVAVGASSETRAAAFAGELGIPNHHGSYAAVLERDDIDAVYIPLAGGLHFRWGLEAARAGKHALVEKPLVASLHEARELHAAFRAADRRLMEAFMWRHTPRTAWLLKQVQTGELGELRRVIVNFSFNLDRQQDYRWHDDQLGGALLDLGCYAANAARLFFGVEPLRVGAAGVPVRPASIADRSVVGWADFGEDRLLTFGCSFTSFYQQELSLVGTHGILQVVQPFSGAERTVIVLHPPERSHEKLFPPANPFCWMGAHFARAVHDPSLSLLPGEDGLEQARMMEALRISLIKNGEPQIPTD